MTRESLIASLRSTADRVIGWHYKGDADPDPRVLMREAADRIEKLDAGLSELLSVAERSRSGDPSLDPEEWCAIRDYCRILVRSGE